MKNEAFITTLETSEVNSYLDITEISHGSIDSIVKLLAVFFEKKLKLAASLFNCKLNISSYHH